MQLSRDEMIMSVSDIVNNLVKKYNNFKEDDDLYQIGMIGVINGVDSCVTRGIKDTEIIKAVCIVRARNAIIDEQRHNSYVYSGVSDDYEIEEIIDDNDTNADLVELQYDLQKSLDDSTYTIYSMWASGYDVNEICDILGKSKTYVYNRLNNLKEFLKSYYN